MPHFDAVVVGTGQAGPSLAVRLAQAGRRTAIIERKQVGGTCVNVGCIPTKTLVASARVAAVARRATEFGVILSGAPEVDMAKVQARMNVVRGESNQGVTQWLLDTKGVELIRGHARFVDPHTLEVNGETISADQIFLNVGGRAQIPPIPGLSEVPFLTNSSVLELTTLPAHLLILGGSYIGLEFAQMYRRFGSEVTILEAGPRLIGREDPDVSNAILQLLLRDGIQVHTQMSNLSFSAGAAAVCAHFDAAQPSQRVEATHCLIAVGRRPNTDDLGLDKAGVRTDARGYITVDDGLCTNVPHIFALGDVNGRGAFTHTAYNDFEIVAANLLDGQTRRVSDRILAYALYIDPPLARVGLSVEAVRTSGRAALSARMMMTRVGRARERSETDGFMEIVVDAKTEEILGATLFGIEADEAIHSILDLMYARATYKLLARAMHIHPTVSELLPTLVEDLKPLI
ncbi:MAG: FAD-containing oxidoreductase [Burkholderiaceae bacterium]|jgi:pyruvate/2-oxoglutarate dehydrogenase complex dihydrolipoamide dehydrogenase (E3) component